jgi:hypothetical protein
MTARDDRLTALQDAVDNWADAEERRLQDEKVFLESVFNGRTNGGQLSQFITEEASSLLEDEVNAYLVE